MQLDARQPEKPAGILIDHGTGRRIPFARWFDSQTGQFEAFVMASNGVDIACDENYRPLVIKGKAVGRLELIPIGNAAQFGFEEPKKVIEQPLTVEQKQEGLDQYKKLYLTVWRWRGESGRVALTRWEEFLQQNDFLDHLVIKRRVVPVSSD